MRSPVTLKRTAYLSPKCRSPVLISKCDVTTILLTIFNACAERFKARPRVSILKSTFSKTASDFATIRVPIRTKLGARR
ncbi:hypothetical protein CEXT_738921 [Caerostris extrusa]|uniref:Uncharacterized protein n=1 Tax=Caerostris extrusa TaxID=172846 RepID=A0AAV4W9K7_CAEEX|nr:hypothetical protein CEXT_738921 [Caerostris extrusa]